LIVLFRFRNQDGGERSGHMKKKVRRRRRFVIALVAFGAFGLLGAWVAAGLPSRSEVRDLADKRPGKTALMRQREGEAERKGENTRLSQTWVPLTRISRHLLHAVLASEDQRFFGHRGVDWTALRESVEDNVERRRLWRGGSTLTQQLAKNLFFGTSRTPVRKARELVVTRWLEEDLTKFRILTLYLNVIEWGDGIYGAEAAAGYWYGKPASTLTPEEAAGLAAMIPNPRRINPRRNPRWFERARGRVLGLMERSGYLGRDLAGLGADPDPAPEPASQGEARQEPEATPTPPEAPVPR
jgi:monofunctional biosynthetic peptidoglycan transglycosylase